MSIYKNVAFKKIEGTVFVVVCDAVGVIDAVFKTKTAADKFSQLGKGLSVRVGHFLPDGRIETI